MIDSLILTLVKMTFSTADLVEFRTLLSIGWNPAQIFPWLPMGGEFHFFLAHPVRTF